MKQEAAWWTGFFLSLFNAAWAVHTYRAARRKEEVQITQLFVPTGDGRTEEQLRVPCVALRYDDKRAVCIIPRYGVLQALGKDALLSAQRQRRGYTLTNVTPMSSAEAIYAINEEWPA